MNCITDIIKIRRPIKEVYEYVTTPKHWPSWQPTSIDVIGSVDHSLTEGEQVMEQIRLVGRPRTILWTVREQEAPYHWIADGELKDGGHVEVIYRLKLEGDDTVFERQASYRVDRPLLALLAPLLRGRAQRRSVKALDRLRENLEQEPNTPGEMLPD